MNLFLLVAAAIVRRDPGELLGLKAQVAEAIADTRGPGSRQELIDLKNEISEVLDDLATGEAWSILREARAALTSNPGRAHWLRQKLGPTGPAHLLRAVVRDWSLRRALEALDRELTGTGPCPPASRVVTPPRPQPRPRLFPLRGGIGHAAA